jgi:excisionase family DNA binding protein
MQLQPTEHGEPEALYLVAEVAAMLRVDHSTVYRAVASGALKALRIGKGRGTLRIPAAAFRAYCASLATHPSKSPGPVSAAPAGA